jgi:hypothetical protein
MTCDVVLLVLPCIAGNGKLSSSDQGWLYRAPSVEAMVWQSSIVVVGTPGESWVETPAELAVPLTVWPLKIKEIWYKEPLIDSLGIADSLTVCAPGGRHQREAGGETIEEILVDAPRLVTGSRHLLFLEKVTLEIAPHIDHFRVTELDWGIASIDDDGVIRGGAFEGENRDALRERVIQIGSDKAPRVLFKNADAVIRGNIGETHVELSPDSVKLNVTQIEVVEWLKGSGENPLYVEARKYVSGSSKWSDRAFLPTGMEAFLFLEGDGDRWQLLNGKGGLYCIDSFGKLFAVLSRGQFRYVGLTSEVMSTALGLAEEKQ